MELFTNPFRSKGNQADKHLESDRKEVEQTQKYRIYATSDF